MPDANAPTPEDLLRPAPSAPRAPKNQKAGAIVVLGMVTLFCLAGSGSCVAKVLGPHDEKPVSAELAAVMDLPSGKWVTVRGAPNGDSVFQPSFLGIGTSEVRMLQLDGSPLVVFTTLKETPDLEAESLELTGVLEDTSDLSVTRHTGEIEYRSETIDVDKYCREKSVHCVSQRHLVLRVGDRPSGLLGSILGAVALGLLGLLLGVVTISVAVSKPKPDAAPA